MALTLRKLGIGIRVRSGSVLGGLAIAIGVGAVLFFTGHKGPEIALALAPLLGGFAWDRWQQRAERRAERGKIVRHALACVPPPSALDPRLANALTLAPEPEHDISVGSSWASEGGLPPYRKLDIDDTLRERLMRALQNPGPVAGRFSLVQGESKTEMARTAYEALGAVGRELAKESKTVGVLVPGRSERSPSALRELLSLDPFPFDTSVVLWLDQLDAYLRPGATLTVADLGQLTRLDPPGAVLATIERRAREAINSPEGRAVLAEFAVVHIDELSNRE